MIVNHELHQKEQHQAKRKWREYRVGNQQETPKVLKIYTVYVLPIRLVQ